MKNLILLTLLLSFSLFSQEINSIRTVVLLEIVKENNIIVSSNVMGFGSYTNKVSRYKVNLVNDIKKLESDLVKLTNGIPTSYIGNSDSNSTNMITRLNDVWDKYSIMVSNLTSKKLEFNKKYEK